MKICINGGHYPHLDSGALGSHITEAEYTMELMESVASYLEAAGCEVLRVQENDLAEITSAANDWGADLFVSLHCNAANKRARGTESYAYTGSEEGRRLAACIQSQLTDSIDTVDRGVKEASFYVLRYTDCPAALIEVAFIDNEEDEQLLLSHKDQIARAIARGVTDAVVSMNQANKAQMNG